MSTIYLGLICRNEARDIGRCLLSAKDACDGLVLIDTGSNDNTLEVAQAAWPKDKPFIAATYTAASELKDGNWRIKNFSQARNQYLELVSITGADWVFWLDADDELLTPDVIRRGSNMMCDVLTMWIEQNGTRWITHRMWRAKAGVRFFGRCHEYPRIDGLKMGHLDDCLIRHHVEPDASQENANKRNLRILVDEWNEDGPNPRTAFYMANTHRDAGRWAEAAWWYERRIGLGVHYQDEWLFAHLYLVRCLRQVGDTNRAQFYLSQGISHGKDWCEFLMEYAWIAHDNKDYQTAIQYATRCVDQPIPPTQLWREPNCYTDGPLRLMSWCCEHMGNIKDALYWAKEAKEKIGVPDKDWDDRITRLSHIMMVDPQYA